MSFLKSLFGLGKSTPAAPAAAPALEHNGYTIEATPFLEGREYQTCGIVKREIDGVVKEHKFIRVDKFPSRDEAVAFTFRKGQQIIDQMGDRMFT